MLLPTEIQRTKLLVSRNHFLSPLLSQSCFNNTYWCKTWLLPKNERVYYSVLCVTTKQKHRVFLFPNTVFKTDINFMKSYCNRIKTVINQDIFSKTQMSKYIQNPCYQSLWKASNSVRGHPSCYSCWKLRDLLMYFKKTYLMPNGHKDVRSYI